MLGKILVKIDELLGKLIFRSLLPFSYIFINKKLYKKIKYQANSINQNKLIRAKFIKNIELLKPSIIQLGINGTKKTINTTLNNVYDTLE